MAFLAEQHLVAAKLVRRNGATRSGAERELFIRISSPACASWRRSGAASVWTISIGVRLRRIGASSMNKVVGFRRLKSMVHPSFPISDPRSSNMKLFARKLNHRAARRRIPVWNRCGHPGTGVEPLPHLRILKEIVCCHRSTHHADLP
jgi:hypothetical protein